MACSVKINRHNHLAFCIHWNGREWWEGLGVADAISAEIRARSFSPARYLHYLAHGNCAAEFEALAPQGAPCPTPVSAITVGRYADTWLPRQRPPFVRPAQQRDYERDIRRCVLPTWIEDETGRRQFGDLLLVAVAPRHLLQLRERLVARRLALKTVRNIMDASLRAMTRDAQTVDLLITTNPFLALTWPRVSAPPPPVLPLCRRVVSQRRAALGGRGVAMARRRHRTGDH